MQKTTQRREKHFPPLRDGIESPFRRRQLLFASSLALAEERRATAGDEHRGQSARQRLTGGGGGRFETRVDKRQIIIMPPFEAIDLIRFPRNQINTRIAMRIRNNMNIIKLFNTTRIITILRRIKIEFD